MRLKNLIIMFLLLLSAASLSAQTLADKYQDKKGFTTVYISGAMFKSFPTNMANVNIGSLMSSIESFIVITTDKPEQCKELASDIGKMRKDKSYELLMKVNDDSSKVDFLVKKNDKDIIKELIMIVEDKGDFTLIQLNGSFTMKDIEQMVEMNK